ncbi:MAG: hypothetical protein ACOC8B_03125 [Gemmatimonadota bacterium]
MDAMLAARRRTIARNALRRARDAAFTAEVRAELSRLDAPSPPRAGPTRDPSANPAPGATPATPATPATTAIATTAASGPAPTGSSVEDLGPLAAPVLEHLDRWGPCEVAEIPHRWPLSRMHLRHLVRELVDAGLAEWVEGGEGAPRRVRPTGLGRRAATADRARQNGRLR